MRTGFIIFLLFTAGAFSAAAQAPLPNPQAPPVYGAQAPFPTPSEQPSYPPMELDRLVSPVALYPDPLLAQVMTAATFAPDIPEAVRWADQHHYLPPDAIAQAATKGLYDRLVSAGLADFLADEAGDKGIYHLVLAADVFVYVNDLAPIIAGIARILAPEGLLAFTVETHAGDGVKLLPTLRYAHGEDHVRGVLGAAGLMPAHLAKAAARSEKGVPVDSLVVVAQPSTTMHRLATSGE